MGEHCELATVESARAFWMEDALKVCAWGENPDLGSSNDIERSWLDVWPPEYSVVRCRGGLSIPVVSPYSVAVDFSLGSRPDTVKVYRSGGPPIEVVVEDIPTVDVSAQAIRSVSEDPAKHFDEATGYSSTMNLTEATLNALQQLPSPNAPDEQKVALVAGWGVINGGLVGTRLFVTLRQEK